VTVNVSRETSPPDPYGLSALEIRALLADGERLFRREHEGDPSLEQVVMTLLSEAAATLRAIRADRPSAFGSSWPEIAEMSQVAAENARNLERAAALADGRPFDPDLYAAARPSQPRPSAAALQRLLAALSMLRWIKARTAATKGARMRLMLALAAGMSPTRAAGVFPELGYGNKNAVLAAKHRSLACIVQRINSILTCEERTGPR
jgi:hypothetical protein